MRALLALPLLAVLTAGALAQDAVATPEGDWQDEYGTTLRMSFCGDGTQLCAVLLDVQGESRTEENLSFINKQVMQADMTGPNQWHGTVTFNGAQAESTLTQVAADTIEIEGCRVVVLCQTLSFNRV